MLPISQKNLNFLAKPVSKLFYYQNKDISIKLLKKFSVSKLLDIFIELKNSENNGKYIHAD